MRKKVLGLLLLLAVFAFEGCQRSSDRFLAYEDSVAAFSYATDNDLTQGHFFAEDIAIVTDEDNVGGDEQLTAGASLLIDISDNKVIYADHVYDRMYPASLTKLLTALVVLREGELTDPVTVSYDASHITEANARVCGYEEGDIISLEALLNSLLIYSGNDAAIAAADHVAGSEEVFAERMNDVSSQIGAVHSNFVNSHGLHDDNHYTTAYDIYLIFNELLQYDSFRNIIHTDSFTAQYTDKDGNEKEKTFTNSNRYLSGEESTDLTVEVLGGKTGTTNKAGNCLVLLCKDINDKEYIAVIMKASDSDSLYSQMSHLLSKVPEK